MTGKRAGQPAGQKKRPPKPQPSSIPQGKPVHSAYDSFFEALHLPDCDSSFIHYKSDVGLARITLAAASLGVLLGIHATLFLLSSSTPLTRSWSYYFVSLSLFHLLEFLLTAAFNARTCTWDSFLLNHSRAYVMAIIISWFEFWLGALLFPEWKTWVVRFTLPLSLLPLSGGQLLRIVAMITAGKHFTHMIASKKVQGHNLVTAGVYSFLRHPGYCGWFYWSVGTQIALGNPLSFCLYVYASWKFFAERIPYEEYTLLKSFGHKYERYRQGTIIGIPWIQGYIHED